MAERNLDFDKVINRKNTRCLKYDFAVKRGKPADVLPLWVADMDFETSSYIEDALGHEQHMQTKCNDYANQFQDAELANFVRQLSNKHQQAMAQLFQLVK